MSVSRRQFLTGIASIAGLGLAPLVRVEANTPSIQFPIQFLSARGDHQGSYYLSGMDQQGRVRFDVELPGRGHGMAVHPKKHHAIAFARRPGDFLLVIDIDNGKVLHQLTSSEQRHFFGHGVFSQDGRWLYTTENDLDSNQGVIGVRDVHNGYKQVAEFPSYGIGPHQLLLANDGNTLVIANGGILTRPESGRSKLNIDTMSPSLVYVDSGNGELVSEHKLPAELHKNSIRHIAIAPDDTVCIGLQYQGEVYEQPLLVGLHRPGSDIRLLETPAPVLSRMRNYCGSVSVDSSGQVFAVSSPRGNLVTFWSAKEGNYLGHTDVTDGCGIATAPGAGEFYISSGMGSIWRYRLADNSKVLLSSPSSLSARWDNHML